MHLFMMKLDIGLSANAAKYLKKPMELTTYAPIGNLIQELNIINIVTPAAIRL